jgi:hypothetical protein
VPEHLLVLHPRDPAYAPANMENLASMLGDIGFIGEALDALAGHYAAGQDFLRLITFLGCSPVVNLGRAERGPECRVRLPTPLAAPRFLYGANTKPPRCPACRGALGTDTALGSVWERDSGTTRVCPRCGAQTPVHLLDWRRTAAFVKTSIEITGIHESEAVPAEALLAALKSASGVDWDYCYLRRD